MNTKILFIYNFFQLFKLLNEIEKEFNYKIYHIDKNNYNKNLFSKFDNYLIVTNDTAFNFNNSLYINSLPRKISKLFEEINIRYLRNYFIKQSNIKIGNYILDINSKKISFQNCSLKLTEKESDLILFMNVKKKASLNELQKEIWGHSTKLETHTVETHIYRLRKKFFDSFKDKNFIKNDQKGYFLNL
jgi:hypothetical protein